MNRGEYESERINICPFPACRHTLFPSYPDSLQSSNGGSTKLELPGSELPFETHECGVCHEVHAIALMIQLPTCSHTFCRECLCTFTKTRIKEGRYPIFCPVCAIQVGRARVDHGSGEFFLSLFNRWMIIYTFS